MGALQSDSRAVWVKELVSSGLDRQAAEQTINSLIERGVECGLLIGGHAVAEAGLVATYLTNVGSKARGELMDSIPGVAGHADPSE